MPHTPITILKKSTPHVLRQVNELLAQLSLGKTPPAPLTRARFNALLGQKNLFFLIARSSDKINTSLIGFVVVYVIRIPSGFLAIAEDLIVDEPYRKWGIGRSLMEYAIAFAKKKGATHLSLRTNPKRAQANKLYQQMGFHLMPTNFFRINFSKEI